MSNYTIDILTLLLFAVSLAVLSFAAFISRGKVRKAVRKGGNVGKQVAKTEQYAFVFPALSALVSGTLAINVTDLLHAPDDWAVKVVFAVLSAVAVALPFVLSFVHFSLTDKASKPSLVTA